MQWIIIVIVVVLILAAIGKASEKGSTVNKDKNHIKSKSDESVLQNVTSNQSGVIELQNTLTNDDMDDQLGFEEYVRKNNISLNARDVEFDITHNIDKEFVIVGVAELANYYNYGYRNLEEYCFCVKVSRKRKDGSYESDWHIYCDRESYKNFYQKMKEGKCYVEMTAVILSELYEPHQGNNAMLTYVSWSKDSHEKL